MNPRGPSLESFILPYEVFIASYRDKLPGEGLPLMRMEEEIYHFNYAAIESMLLIHLDLLDNIKSSIEVDTTKTKYPTGIALVRNARQATALDKRLPPDHPIVLRDNLLLRALSTIRGIDHVLTYQVHRDPHEIYATSKNELPKVLINLLQAVSDKNPGEEELERIEEECTAKLIAMLHKTNLDTDVKEPADYGKLLAYFRDMAATLDPAKSLVTIREEIENNTQKTFIETSHPVTKKTAEQITQLNVMEAKNDNTEKNYHTIKSPVYQLINHAFVDLIKQDDRRLPAQMRYAIAPTIKNGYIVNNKIETIRGGIFTSTEHWSLRAGTMAYVGKGETEEKLIEYAKQNILQLVQMAQALAPDKVKFHFTTLLTDFPKEHQDVMVKVTKAAIAEVNKQYNFDYSYFPANLGAAGTFFPFILGKTIPGNAEKLGLPIPENLFRVDDNKARYEKAGQVINIASNTPDTINISACASGQDRTGTAQEIALVIWEEQEGFKDITNQLLLLTVLADLETLKIIHSIPQEIMKTLKDECERFQAFFKSNNLQTEFNKLTAIQQDKVLVEIEQTKTATPAEIQSKYINIENQIKELSNHVKMSRAIGGHNALLATFATPGSTGIKPQAKPDNYFSELVTTYHYRKKTTKTNKAPKFNEKTILNLYFPAAEKRDLQLAFTRAQKEIQATNDPKKILNALTKWAQIALQYQNTKENPLAKLSTATRHGVFSDSATVSANLRISATKSVEYLRNMKILDTPEEILDEAKLLKKAIEITLKSNPGKKAGVIHSELLDLLDNTIKQIRPSSPHPT